MSSSETRARQAVPLDDAIHFRQLVDAAAEEAQLSPILHTIDADDTLRRDFLKDFVCRTLRASDMPADVVSLAASLVEAIAGPDIVAVMLLQVFGQELVTELRTVIMLLGNLIKICNMSDLIQSLRDTACRVGFTQHILEEAIHSLFDIVQRLRTPEDVTTWCQAMRILRSRIKRKGALDVWAQQTAVKFDFLNILYIRLLHADGDEDYRFFVLNSVQQPLQQALECEDRLATMLRLFDVETVPADFIMEVIDYFLTGSIMSNDDIQLVLRWCCGSRDRDQDGGDKIDDGADYRYDRYVRGAASPSPSYG
ncbi:hypothetical protein HDV00_012359 [Rhizophlyctis rosea]|nr:hypothetical protein HDV00_012359 [Rhizophlyctis rosea]